MSCNISSTIVFRPNAPDILKSLAANLEKVIYTKVPLKKIRGKGA